METKKTTSRVVGLLVAGVALVTNLTAVADVTWTNSAGDLLWSTAANWTPNQVPTDLDAVTFDNTVGGPTNVQGAVNNVVTASISVGRMGYFPTSPNTHTTLLMPGVTVWSNTNAVTANTSPSMASVTGASDVGYATIFGTNASLICGNVATPVVTPSGGCYLEIYYMRSATGTQKATLDMSGLDNFVFGGGVIRIGSVASGNSTRGGARGTMILAKTNFLLAATPKGGYPGDPIGFIGGMMVGARTSTLIANDLGDLQLGITNMIATDYFKIGCYGSSTGLVSFQASVLASNPSLTLRSTNGTARVSEVGIGDSADQTTDLNTPTCLGNVDLTGGTVDALVGRLTVGRNMGSATGGTRRGGGNGTLTWTAGTFDVTDLSLGSQAANNRANAIGVVNVRSNASLVVGATINIGGDLGTGTGTGNGTLNIAYGGQVSVTNNVAENSSGADGSSTVNITKGVLTVGGSITVDTINLDSGTISNVGPITASLIKGTGLVGPVTVPSGGTVSPGNSVGTITNVGGVTLNGGGINAVEVIDAAGAGGVGFDQLKIAGGIDVQANSGNQFNFKLISLNGTGVAGGVTNFDNNSSYVWTVMSTTDTVTNFDASKFTVDTTSFSNDLAGGQFLVETGSVNLRFTNNHAPATALATYSRPADSTLKIKISDLAANWSDPDGQATALAAFSASTTNGLSNVSSNGGFLLYTPGAGGNVADRIDYTIQDLAAYRPADTVRTATGVILVTIAPASTNQTHNITGISTNGDGNHTISFAGIPNQTYVVEAATNIVTPVWVPVGTSTAGANGLWSFTDIEGTNYPSRFYRSARP